MFIPYRVIQVKQRRKQKKICADPNATINIDEMFKHCKN